MLHEDSHAESMPLFVNDHELCIIVLASHFSGYAPGYLHICCISLYNNEFLPSYGPYLQLRHKIKMAAIVGGLCTGSLWGGQCYTIRNPKTFQVRHMYNHPILIHQE